MKDVLESSIERRGVARLWEELGLVARKDGKGGWPDREVLLGHGRHFWWEVKKPKGGRLTRAQMAVFPHLEKLGDIILLNPDLHELLCVAKALLDGDEADLHELLCVAKALLDGDEAVARAFPSVYRGES